MRNLFDEKLKHAKQELTNLKTAHRRGLGNLRTYYYNNEIPSGGHEEGYIWELTITLQFDRNFGSYPFVQLVGALLPSGGSFIDILDVATVRYIDGGYGMKLGAYYSYDGRVNNYVIFSTSPVVSISYEWSEL